MGPIVVTGASGFIGRHLVTTLQARGIGVRGLSRSGCGETGVAIDYADADALARALKDAAAVVHTAGLAHVSARALANPMSAFHVSNTELAMRVAQASVRAGARKFVLLSSAGVLGQASPSGGFTERSPARPHDPYTLSKLEAETRVAEVMRDRLVLEIVRPPMVYGPGAPGSFRRLCQWIEGGRPLPIGCILAQRSFIGIRNLCDLLVTVATRAPLEPIEPRPMLVADPEALSVPEFARLIAHARGRRARIVPVPVALLKVALSALGLREEYRRLALPFVLQPGDARERYAWQAPHSTREEIEWALG